MTILSVPLFGVGDALNVPDVDDAQLEIEPRFNLVLDYRDSMVNILPDGFLSGDLVFRVVRLPRTLRTIKSDVFSGMESLEGMDLSATAVETIGDWFLLEAVSVQCCRFPSTLRAIGWFSLSRTSIKRVDLSHTLVTTLPRGFLSFTPVEVLLVPPCLEGIDCDALQMTCLRRLDCSNTRLQYISRMVLSFSPMVDLRLPPTFEWIAFSAMTGTQLRVVRVGDAEIQWVNEHRFNPEVRELSLPFLVTWIDSDSLTRTSLKRVDLSSADMYRIDDHVLCDNPHLEQVLLSRTLERISNEFLNRAPNLRSLDVRSTQVRTIGDDFLYGTPVEEIWFPDTLRSVGKRFLYGARVTSLDLSNTRLTAVGTDFLQKCDRLQNLLLPEWLIDIPENLPRAGRMAEAIVLPRCIEVLGAPSFQHAPLLRSMDLSQTVVDKLPSLFLSDAPNLMEVRVPGSLKIILGGVFSRTALRTVNLRHTKVWFIEEGFCAFSPLKRLYVPEAFPPQLPELVSVIRYPDAQRVEALFEEELDEQ